MYVIFLTVLNLKGFSNVCYQFELGASLKKTIIMPQSYEAHTFIIKEFELNDVFKNSPISIKVSRKTWMLTVKYPSHWVKTSTMFGRLSKCVCEKNHLCIINKVKVYESCVLGISVKGAELDAWWLIQCRWMPEEAMHCYLWLTHTNHELGAGLPVFE